MGSVTALLGPARARLLPEVSVRSGADPDEAREVGTRVTIAPGDGARGRGAASR